MEATSDVIHLKRFFKPIEKDEEVPIVITSRLHEKEGYAFYPACDVYVAQKIAKDLSFIGVKSKIISDEYMLNMEPDAWEKNLILVCAPFGNKFSKMIFKKRSEVFGKTEYFCTKNGKRTIVTRDKQIFCSDNPLSSKLKKKEDHALIARYIHPLNPKYKIFVFAGTQAIGTYAVGEYLSKTNSYREICEDTIGNELIVVIHLCYDKHNPFDYKLKLKGFTRIKEKP